MRCNGADKPDGSGVYLVDQPQLPGHAFVRVLQSQDPEFPDEWEVYWFNSKKMAYADEYVNAKWYGPITADMIKGLAWNQRSG